MNELDKKRYQRQLILDDFGRSGQEKLSRSSVLVIGIGGLGSIAAWYLAAAGIARIGLVDNDVVSLDNLNRQIIHAMPDMNQLKVNSAQKKLMDLNPGLIVDTHATRLAEDNMEGYSMQYDVIVSAVDNFETKYLINDVCVRSGKPFVHAGIYGWQGQLFTYDGSAGSACLRCLKQSPAQNADNAGPIPVLGTVAGTLGVLQASECIKLLTGKGQLLVNRLLVHDALTMKFKELHFNQQNNCCCAH